MAGAICSVCGRTFDRASAIGPHQKFTHGMTTKQQALLDLVREKPGQKTTFYSKEVSAVWAVYKALEKAGFIRVVQRKGKSVPRLYPVESATENHSEKKGKKRCPECKKFFDVRGIKGHLEWAHGGKERQQAKVRIVDVPSAESVSKMRAAETSEFDSMPVIVSTTGVTYAIKDGSLYRVTLEPV